MSITDSPTDVERTGEQSVLENTLTDTGALIYGNNAVQRKKQLMETMTNPVFINGREVTDTDEFWYTLFLRVSNNDESDLRVEYNVGDISHVEVCDLALIHDVDIGVLEVQHLPDSVQHSILNTLSTLTRNPEYNGMIGYATLNPHAVVSRAGLVNPIPVWNV